MKIKELSIGDWVMYRNREWQVCSLYQFTGEVGLWRKDSQICENVADLTPILLTPEILERNGWKEYSDYHNSWKFDVAENTRVWLFKNSHDWTFQVMHWGLGHNHCTAKAYIEHVHQLQHALRLAGIDKEIEL